MVAIRDVRRIRKGVGFKKILQRRTTMFVEKFFSKKTIEIITRKIWKKTTIVNMINVRSENTNSLHLLLVSFQGKRTHPRG